MQCLILAGGLGTRLGSVAGNLPKHLVPVDGSPFAHHLLSLLARNGVTHVVYAVGHRGEQIERYVGDGRRWGVKVDYVYDGDPLLGTGGAVRRAVDAGVMNSSFFVTYGDSYLPIDYRAVWRNFEGCGTDVLMTVFRNQGSWDRSNAEFSDGRVTIYAKRGQPGHRDRMRYIDFGLLCMTSIFVQAEIPAATVVDLNESLNRASVAGRLAGYEVTRRFYEVGSVGGIADLEAFLQAPPSPRHARLDEGTSIE